MDPLNTDTLSFWGWGHRARFPDLNARRQLADLLTHVLGFPAHTPRPEPALSDLHLPAPRVAIPPALADFASDSTYARASHTYGKNFPDLWRGFHGDYPHPPDWVLAPRDEDDVLAALRWARDAHAALIPFGGGTSVVGGIEAGHPDGYSAVVSLDMRRMDRLLDIDHDSRRAHLQAGASGPEVEAHLSPHNLTLRHFPQSFEFSTLGGWIATRAGGHFATLYTHIDDLVASIRAITPEGILETPRWPASGAGPEPQRLLLGSEGTLGIITSAWMRVRPRPRWRSKVSVHFTDWSDAVHATRLLAQSDLYPTNCRLLDSREALLHQVSLNKRHVLMLGFESASSPTRDRLDTALALIAPCNGDLPRPPKHTDTQDADTQRADDAAAASWRRAFLDAPYTFNAMISLGVVVDTFETACTWAGFEALHNDIVQTLRAAIRDTCGHPGLITCRFTHVYPDGPAPYYTFIASPPAHTDPLTLWRLLKTLASDILLKHGAPITHHHAVGRLHKPWHLRQTPPLHARSLQAVKNTLDPLNLLNPGALIGPPPDQDA